MSVANNKLHLSSPSLKFISRLFILLSIFYFMNNNLFAAGLQFLRIPVFSRSEGMAGAYTGVAEGCESFFYNPAGLSAGEKTDYEATAGYVSWLEGMSKESIVFITPADIFPIVRGISIDYFTVGDLKKYNVSGTEIGALDYQDIAAAVNLGADMGNFIFGCNLKYLKEDIDKYKGSGFAVDAGILYPFSKTNRIGLSASNMGSFSLEDVSIDLPITIRAGLGISGKKVTLGLDAEKNADNTYLHLGGELKLQERYFLRAGIKNAEMGNVTTFGLGMNTELGVQDEWKPSFQQGQKTASKKVLKINYSFQGGGYFSESIHRFDIGVSF
ncbi:MAG: hypothetical protein COT16_00220 [Elusimicrobia bacterium CG08_land_8_20_14_0_20_44_26]|nr:MAG: hypothetical protein COT16_00220 [Elusimicrobia bacterium CG08_land_8_20_14_0_20_44_26]